MQEEREPLVPPVNSSAALWRITQTGQLGESEEQVLSPLLVALVVQLVVLVEL